jgi:ribosomal-protein-alanine N-acetyltransferase
MVMIAPLPDSIGFCHRARSTLRFGWIRVDAGTPVPTLAFDTEREAERSMGVEPDVTFLPMGPDVLDRLLQDDLRGASDAVGAALPEFFRAEKWLWQIRSDQIRQSPGSAPWLVRAVVDPESGAVVGHAGFHGPPDEAGAVEVGYTVVPDWRGRGFAHRILASLVAEALAAPDVALVRASVRPDNLPSLAVVRKAGMRHVGEQWDDVDGRELVFELTADDPVRS